MIDAVSLDNACSWHIQEYIYAYTICIMVYQ
jgi:hypothetical protein